MSREEKAMHLCREYDRLTERIKDLTTSIGHALDGCSLAAKGAVDSKGRTVTHLTDAYSPFNEEDDWGNYMAWHDEIAQLEILSVCSSCGIAHKHIQERKAARKAFGIIKRQIRMIGRSA